MARDAPDPTKARRTPVWRAFAQPAAGTMLLFGFSSGLPFLLVAGTLAFWLKQEGIALSEITMIASAGMFYALKFLWAPLLDHFRLPVFGRFGRRRGWLLFAQLGVVVALIAMVAATPAHLPAFIAGALALAWFGATQDIAIDAYRIEIAPLDAQGALVATYVLGYRFGLLVAGALAPIMADHVSWPAVYAGMAAAMLVPTAATLIAREPDFAAAPAPTSWSGTLRAGTVDPLSDFFRRYGVALGATTLLFILIFKLPEQATIGGIMSPFYRDMGFSQTEIGAVTKIYGIWIGILGAFLGGAAVARFGVWPTLFVAIVVCGCSNLLYLVLPHQQGNLVALSAVISGENLSLGFLGPPTVAFLSSLVNREHTATQYALLASLLNLPGKILGFFAGSIVAATGYATFFTLTVLAVPPAAALCLWLWARERAQSKDARLEGEA